MGIVKISMKTFIEFVKPTSHLCFSVLASFLGEPQRRQPAAALDPAALEFLFTVAQNPFPCTSQARLQSQGST